MLVPHARDSCAFAVAFQGVSESITRSPYLDLLVALHLCQLMLKMEALDVPVNP
jgi:hypothetical protein